MRRVVIVPITNDQSPTRFIASASMRETLAQNALWTYNKMREHDGQEALKKMPKGTKYEKVPV